MAKISSIIHELGQFAVFSKEALIHIPYNIRHPGEFLANILQLGVKTVPVILLTGFFSGMILGLELSSALEAVIAGTSQFIGGALSLALLKEMGPVLTSLIVVSRVCSSVTAHLGTMKVTEQIDALKTFAVNPIRYLVSPRVLAGIVSLPILGLMSILASFLGGMLMVTGVFGTNINEFWEIAQYPLKIKYVITSIVKMSIIGGVILLISTYDGFHTKGGAAGVGDATIKSVVTSSFMVILLDYLIGTLFIVFNR